MNLITPFTVSRSDSKVNNNNTWYKYLYGYIGTIIIFKYKKYKKCNDVKIFQKIKLNQLIVILIVKWTTLITILKIVL